MKSFFIVLFSAALLFSCNDNSTTSKKTGDSATTGLEGSREDASQLSNATINTSAGQTTQRKAKDSSMVKDSMPKK